jgi:DinB family protein
MPFAFFKRLDRRRQAIYLKSDALTAVPLPRPEAARPLVAALADALRGEDREETERAARKLVAALAAALGLPPVRVQVLASRPHARWGELHGLYEWERGSEAPLITLWMRTAKQKRVVAFRTFLRTLLHEVGHHLDYTGLGLGDSFHTQGFYARESHLFHQLVTDGDSGMATLEEQLARMERTPDDLAAAIQGASEAALSKRPDGRSWCAKEIVCHLRDTEELFLGFFQSMLEMDEPAYSGGEPDRWAEDRQYRRNDAGEALAAFRRRRAESLAFLRHLRPADWNRRGVHPTRGPLTMRDFVGLMAEHDDNHLDQLRRALDGKP